MLFMWTSCKTSTSSNCIIWPGKAGLGLHDLWDIYNIPISSCGNIWQMAPVYDQQLYDIYISMIKQCQTNDHFPTFQWKNNRNHLIRKVILKMYLTVSIQYFIYFTKNVFDKIRKYQWRKYQRWDVRGEYYLFACVGACWRGSPCGSRTGGGWHWCRSWEECGVRDGWPGTAGGGSLDGCYPVWNYKLLDIRW